MKTTNSGHRIEQKRIKQNFSLGYHPSNMANHPEMWTTKQ